MISNDNLVHDLVCTIAIREPTNFNIRVLKGEEAPIVETEHEFSYSCTTDSVQSCQPRFIFKVARKAIVCTLK
jgi:hypothetical protein